MGLRYTPPGTLEVPGWEGQAKKSKECHHGPALAHGAGMLWDRCGTGAAMQGLSPGREAGFEDGEVCFSPEGLTEPGRDYGDCLPKEN